MISLCALFFASIMSLCDKMDVFLLEDDDCNELFITQTSKGDACKAEDKEEDEMEVFDDLFLGVKPDDFASPSVKIVDKGPHYSDISEAEEEAFEAMEVNDGR